MSSQSDDTVFDAFTVEEVPKVNFIEKWRRRIRDAPENIRLASQSAWRGRERGLAVVAGVFLASLVITTVFSYGVGLSQIFFDEGFLLEKKKGEIHFNTKGNKKRMLTVPRGEDRLFIVSSFLQSDEGIEALKLLEKLTQIEEE